MASRNTDTDPHLVRSLTGGRVKLDANVICMNTYDRSIVETMESLDLAYARNLTSEERRRIRDKAGIPRSVIARDLACAEGTIWRYETSDRKPTGKLGAEYGRLLRALEEKRYVAGLRGM